MACRRNKRRPPHQTDPANALRESKHSRQAHADSVYRAEHRQTENCRRPGGGQGHPSHKACAEGSGAAESQWAAGEESDARSTEGLSQGGGGVHYRGIRNSHRGIVHPGQGEKTIGTYSSELAMGWVLRSG